jgi:beta-lysine 5,6-aminomutase beta subunit
MTRDPRLGGQPLGGDAPGPAGLTSDASAASERGGKPDREGRIATPERSEGQRRATPERSEGQLIRPYGDTTGDGMVQLSFTLPIPYDRKADGAALQLANKMGLDPALVVHSKPMGEGFTFFVVYGRVHHLVDLSRVEVVERDYQLLTPKEVNAAVKRALRRRLVVVGGCVGTDAHTVGIDAILNVKGFAGEKGLEYYRELRVVNLGAQVSVPQLVERARQEKADAVLVSQVVTQRDAHLLNTRELSAAFREAYPPDRRPLLVVGGPRFDEAMAADLGVDRVFTRGTTPGEVASYLVHRLARSPR